MGILTLILVLLAVLIIAMAVLGRIDWVTTVVLVLVIVVAAVLLGSGVTIGDGRIE